MSNAKDIAEHGTAFCAAALAFIMAPGAGLAAAAVPAATLTAIGYSIRHSNSRRACDRASYAALEQLKKHPDFVPADLACAAALLKDAPRPVDLSPADLRQAAATADFNDALARRLAGALAEPSDHALHNILMPVFAAAIAACRQDPDFHRDLTQDLLIDAARQNGLQLRLLDQINARTAATHHEVVNFGAKLDDIAAQSRDTLEALALRFGITEPERMPLAELRGILIDKAKDYHRLLAQVQTLQDREGRIGNLKAAAEDAIRALRLDEAKQLIRDAIAVQRTEHTLTALRDDAGLVETEADIALLEGDAEEACRLLAGAADSFAPFDRLGAVECRRAYLQKLYFHGLRYGGTATLAAIKLGRANLDCLNETEDAYIWAICQNDIGIALQNHGKQIGGEAGAAMLSDALSAISSALRVRTKGEHPLDWAMTQNNFGNALLEQGRRTGGVTGARQLAHAVEAYHAARLVYADGHFLEWAMTQNNLGNALLEQCRRIGGTDGATLLAKAVIAYRSALRVYSEREHPLDWAMTQNNLGNALAEQGSRTEGEEGTALLAEAVTVYLNALSVYTEREHPLGWEMAQNNLGSALAEQGSRTEGEEGTALLAEAVTVYRKALRVHSEGEHPLHWAMAQGNLGNTLLEQGRRTSGAEGAARLAEAVTAYRNALRVRTEREHPLHWAMTQENLGLAHEASADSEICPDRRADLGQAARLFEAALQVYDPEHMPHDYQRASASLDRVRAKLDALS